VIENCGRKLRTKTISWPSTGRRVTAREGRELASGSPDLPLHKSADLGITQGELLCRRTRELAQRRQRGKISQRRASVLKTSRLKRVEQGNRRHVHPSRKASRLSSFELNESGGGIMQSAKTWQTLISLYY